MYRIHYIRRMAWIAAVLVLSGCGRSQTATQFYAKNIDGVMPNLEFTLTDQDGRTATAEDFKGKITLLYFGFTNCPYACPTTLAHLAQVLKRLGTTADSVRVIFVSVDPTRDSSAVLKRYTASFAPQIVGMTGSDAQLTAVTKRYRVAYRRDEPDANGNYNVYHSSAVFVFDGSGRARLLTTSDEPEEQLAHDLSALTS